MSLDNIIESAKARAKRLGVTAPPKGYVAGTRKRNHKKRHSENKERSFKDRKKHSVSVHAQKQFSDVIRCYNRAVSEYWQGKRVDYPTIGTDA